MMGNGTNMVWNTLNFWTAQIMGDTERYTQTKASGEWFLKSASFSCQFVNLSLSSPEIHFETRQISFPTFPGGLSQASSFFLISNMGMKDEEDQRLDTFLRAIRSSLQICAKYASWPPPDNDIYLAESVRDPQLDNIDETNGANKFDYVVAISFNWTDYFMLCAPSYCEYVEANTVMWVLFAAVAQVGGFVSAMLFALRTVFWPLSCMLFGWPTCFETCLNKRANVDSPRSDERGDILMEAP
uniref:Uncharacterized protein LOC114914116 n=1 Tax=Elaeis guineensis var. tenera TaxID=51953 RepID=A0A8N4F6J8_ELAGV|nr:uncharacterized protein LOC114914116 [Elaeis guineensis]